MIKKIKQNYIIFFYILFFFSITNSQQFSNLENGENPIEIYADEGIEWHKNKNKYVAIGNAKAVSGSLSLESDRIEAFYDEKEGSGMNIKEVKAKKNVIVEDKKMRITGGNYAEYSIKKDYFKINGKNIILTSESNILKSNEKIEYWRSKNIAIATGKAEAKKNNEFIVKGDKLVWYLKEVNKKTKVKKILGFKNVSIKTNNEVAFSDKAIYNNETEICKLFGNVKLQRGESFLLGEYAEVDLRNGISKLLPAPGKNLNENKVRALIDKGGMEPDEPN
ncbi:MAG: LptA/OstA family protein [Pseudomonadota bacterium]|nr:LptA/OstA family protein [Pseudomonadota bacterium]